MSAALSDTSHTTSPVKGSTVVGSAVVELLVSHRHTHAETDTGATPTLVSPGDNNFTTKPTIRENLEKYKVLLQRISLTEKQFYVIICNTIKLIHYNDNIDTLTQPVLFQKEDFSIVCQSESRLFNATKRKWKQENLCCQ